MADAGDSKSRALRWGQRSCGQNCRNPVETEEGAMKTGNYAGHMLAGEWRRQLRKLEAAWRERRHADRRAFDRAIARLKRFKPKDVGAFQRAVRALRKR